MATLQKNIRQVDSIPDQSASVIDGMGLVQRVKGDELSFGDVANVFSMVLKGGATSGRIDVVFATYPKALHQEL